MFHTMGAFSSTNSQLPANTIVGRYSSIAAQVRRMAGNHPMERFTTSMLTYSKNTCAFNDYLDAAGVEFDHRPSTVGGMEPIVIGMMYGLDKMYCFLQKVSLSVMVR
ncbi:hypothetical protein QI042_11890 [Staphylococcus saprophyticus]|nr:hypothetical protein [Staphylococcus saprophyticus]